MPSRPPGPPTPDPKKPAAASRPAGGAGTPAKPGSKAPAAARKAAAKPPAPRSVPAGSPGKATKEGKAPKEQAAKQVVAQPGSHKPGPAKAPASSAPKPASGPKASGKAASPTVPVATKAAAGAKAAKPPEPKPAEVAQPARPRKFPKGGPSKAELKKLRARLQAMLTGNRDSSEDLEREALQSSGQDVSVDHMADHGTDSFERDFTLGLLEGKSALAREIQDAIDKIDGKGELPYGVCEACADRSPERWARGCETCPWIPTGRLEAVPQARLCVRKQEEREGSR